MQITVKNVSKVLRKKYLLKNVNMTFESGKVYGLRGYNGSGKTMLLRAVCGLIRPTEGEVCVGGQILGKDTDYPSSVGILIESPAFLPDFSGLKNLKMIAALKNCIDEEHIIETLKKAGLADSMNIKYRKYSLGMKQRLAIAAAIMEQPEILLLDEPTNALDAEGIQMVTDVVREMKSENRIIIIASHEKEFLENVSDSICEIEHGTIVRAGELDDKI